MKKKFINTALAYLAEGGWTGRDKPIRKLKAAHTAEDVWSALWYAAEYIGRRKGWGEEGIGELHGQFLDEIAKRCGIENDSEEFHKVVKK
jgi:hypothetical protein